MYAGESSKVKSEQTNIVLSFFFFLLVILLLLRNLHILFFWFRYTLLQEIGL